MYDSASRSKMLEFIKNDDYASFDQKRYARYVISCAPGSDDYKRVTKERDAAIADVRAAVIDELGACELCAYNGGECLHPDGAVCGDDGVINWQWRGVEVEG